MCFVHASQSNIFTRLAFFLDLPWLNYLVVVYKVLLFCYRYSPKIILKCHDLQHDLTGNFLCDTTFAVLVRQLTLLLFMKCSNVFVKLVHKFFIQYSDFLWRYWNLFFCIFFHYVFTVALPCSMQFKVKKRILLIINYCYFKTRERLA